VRLFANHLDNVRSAYPEITDRRLIHETIRRMINTLATDLIQETEKNVREHGVQNLDEVRAAPALAAFSTEVYEQQRELKAFLRTHLYRHYHVMRMSAKARRIISDLFRAFMEDGRLLPPQYQRGMDEGRDTASGAKHADMNERARAVSDYIAGMTDRYAIREHRRIFAVEEI
jgi:dGTPase